MFDIITRRDNDKINDYCVIKTGFSTLAEAGIARDVSSDLVVFNGTSIVVNDTQWLFPWEKLQPHSYAHRALRDGKTVKEYLGSDYTPPPCGLCGDKRTYSIRGIDGRLRTWACDECRGSSTNRIGE